MGSTLDLIPVAEFIPEPLARNGACPSDVSGEVSTYPVEIRSQ